MLFRSLHPVAAHHDGNGYRDDPQGCQCHPPIKGEQAQGNEHCGDEGAEQTGDEVGAVLFQHLAVRHDGACQVGKIPLAKEGQGQLAQPLCKGQAAGAALFIGGKIGAVVLEPCGCLLYTSPERRTADRDLRALRDHRADILDGKPAAQ